MPTPSDAARTAVERLRAARERAQQRRDASRTAVERLRQRNREESARLAERSRVARWGQHQWPAHDQPREMHLYEADDPPEQPPPPASPAPPAQPQPQPRPNAGRPQDDDWPHESWLH